MSTTTQSQPVKETAVKLTPVAAAVAFMALAEQLNRAAQDIQPDTLTEVARLLGESCIAGGKGEPTPTAYAAWIAALSQNAKLTFTRRTELCHVMNKAAEREGGKPIAVQKAKGSGVKGSASYTIRPPAAVAIGI